MSFNVGYSLNDKFGKRSIKFAIVVTTKPGKSFTERGEKKKTGFGQPVKTLRFNIDGLSMLVKFTAFQLIPFLRK
jgi:hypothetical protein